MTEAKKFANSRAVLVGVSAYEYEEFTPIRAARNSLQEMRTLLSDSALCDWPADRITVISNPISAADLAVQLADLAENTDGVMLVYYVGHGVLTSRGELCLTVTSTRPDRPEYTGVTWNAIADIMRACPARIRVTILDCCFAGQAIETLAGEDGSNLADIAHVEGVYTLTATTRNRTAHVPPPSRQETERTSFTGALIDLVNSGIPGGPPDLTFSVIYPYLRQSLTSRGLPTPNQRSIDSAENFVFAKNVAANPKGSAYPAEQSPIIRALNVTDGKYGLTLVRPYIRWELYDDPGRLGAGLTLIFRNGWEKPIQTYIERFDVTINGVVAEPYGPAVVRKLRMAPGQEREYRAAIISGFPIDGFYGTASYSILYGPLDGSVIYRRTHAFNFSVENLEVKPEEIRKGNSGSTYWTDVEEESDHGTPAGFTFP